ncbi:ABC transporter permease [Paenibacillus piscarius]|uniref:ABC transporter permease n=1 Tax=Paenibacillus piscarius TaxID=1089681 RepID=UPI003B75C0A6
MEANISGMSKRKRLKKHIPLTLLALPGLIYLLLNNYIPMVGSIIAFKNFNPSLGIFGSDWTGFDNFKYLFLTSDAYIITRNTLLYNGLFILLNAVAGITVALLLNEIRQKFMLKLYQSAVLIPFLISFVVVSYLVYGMLSAETGYMNRTVLPFLGLEPIQWYMDSTYWPLILIFINTWKFVGYNCVIYFASIIGIDQELYEAATLDGASKWKQITHITLPGILPTIVMLALIGVGRIFYSDFGLFYQVPMNQGILTDVTNTIDTYVYRSLMLVGDYGMSSAAGLYQGAVGFVLILAVNLAVRKFNKENALF